MKKDISEKLKKNGLEIQAPPELKAKRSIFMRQLDKHVGQHTAEEMEREILKNQDWIRTITVTKIKEYTHVAKIELESVEIADRVLRDGLLMYWMHISPSQMSREEFISIQTCFSCYQMEDHPTNKCKDSRRWCSECGAEEGHRWQECQSKSKKCTNCGGPHRTLAMACPKKREKIQEKKYKRKKKNKYKEGW